MKEKKKETGKAKRKYTKTQTDKKQTNKKNKEEKQRGYRQTDRTRKKKRINISIWASSHLPLP